MPFRVRPEAVEVAMPKFAARAPLPQGIINQACLRMASTSLSSICGKSA
jgi:hypothetical protein